MDLLCPLCGELINDLDQFWAHTYEGETLCHEECCEIAGPCSENQYHPEYWEEFVSIKFPGSVEDVPD